MTPMVERNGIAYGLLDAGDLEELAHLLGDTFSRGEVMAIAIGLPADEIAALVRLFCPAAVEQQITIVAREAAGRRMVGAMLSDDFAVPPPDGLEAFECFAPIGTLLEDLDVRYREGKTIRPGECLHLFMIGVDAGFAGRGIAQQLVATSCDHAAGRGYTTAITEATGSASQQVFRKLGFEDRFATSYRDYRFDGKAVFAGIEGPTGTILMERYL